MSGFRKYFLLAIGLYYCASPVPYERATIEPGVYGSVGGSISLGAGRAYDVTSCTERFSYPAVSFVAVPSKFSGNFYKAFSPNFSLGVDWTLGVTGIYASPAPHFYALPNGSFAFSAKIGNRMPHLGAWAYKLSVGFPLFTQMVLWDLRKGSALLTFAIRHALFQSSWDGLVQEASFWAAVHRDKTAITIGLAHFSAPHSIDYTSFTVGVARDFQGFPRLRNWKP